MLVEQQNKKRRLMARQEQEGNFGGGAELALIPDRGQVYPLPVNPPPCQLFLCTGTIHSPLLRSRKLSIPWYLLRNNISC